MDTNKVKQVIRKLKNKKYWKKTTSRTCGSFGRTDSYYYDRAKGTFLASRNNVIDYGRDKYVIAITYIGDGRDEPMMYITADYFCICTYTTRFSKENHIFEYSEYTDEIYFENLLKYDQVPSIDDIRDLRNFMKKQRKGSYELWMDK